MQNVLSKDCRILEKYVPCNSKRPMLTQYSPKLGFNKINADILEFSSKPYLIIINDHFSQWIKMNLLNNKTSPNITDSMQDIFTRFVYPLE